MVFWHKKTDRETAELICGLLEEGGKDTVPNWNKCKPPPKCKTYLDTLMYYKGWWLIYYNDELDGTHTIWLENGTGRLKEKGERIGCKS